MDFSKYVNTKSFPRHKDSEVNEKVGEIRRSFVGTYDEIIVEIERIKKEAKEQFKKEREEYHEEDHRLICQFKKDLEIEFGLEDHSKKDDLFYLAWDRGHSNGLSEIYDEYDNLSILLK